MLLRPATEEDVCAMARLAATAFIDDPIETYLYPGRREYREKFIDTQESLLRESFDRPCGSAVVVTLESGDEGWQDGPDIVGFCVFTRETHRIRRRGPKSKTKAPSTDAKNTGNKLDLALSRTDLGHPMVDVANSKAMSEACEKGDSHVWIEEGFRKPRERYELCDLGVHPDFRRKGIGKMMVKWVMDKALQEGVPVHSTASPAGKHLYQSMGFRVVGRWRWCPVPNSEWDVMHWNPPDAPQRELLENNGGYKRI